jgi:hypothetical protein
MVVQKQRHSPREQGPQHIATSRTDFKNTRTYTDEEGIPPGEAPTSYGCRIFKLGSRPTITCQVWVANIEMAISVAKVVLGETFARKKSSRLYAPRNMIKPNTRNKLKPALRPHTQPVQLET